MENDINDGVILAARLLLAALFLIFDWRKLTDYSGTVSRMVQDGARIPVPATVVAIFVELPGCVRGRCWSVHACFSCSLGFIHAGNFAHCASLLDSDRCE
jgi:hypothetical protein